MFWRRKRPAEDFAEEVRAHLLLEADELKAQGLPETEAQSAARKAFGNVTGAEERFYERGRLVWLDDLVRDLRYGLRTLRQSPGFTLAVVLTLALGMGANTAIFSLIDAVMLRSLPVEEPSGLYFLNNAGARAVGGAPPYPCFERFRSQSKSFTGMAAYAAVDFLIRIDGRVERVSSTRVSGAYHSVLGLEPFAGRLLTPADERLDPPVAVIGYQYWQRRFGGLTDAIGKHFVFNDRTFTIVGITPPGFYGLVPGRQDDLTVPITVSGARMMADTGSWWFRTIARLKPGVPPEQARAEIDPIFQAFMTEFPVSAGYRQDYVRHMELSSAARGLDDLRKRFSRPLWALMAVVGLVLLIACSNITNLLLARAARRDREFAVRVAIGAGRGRLFRQLLLETGLLFAAGAVAGVLIALWLARSLTAYFAGGSRPILLHVQWDWRVLGFAAGLSLVATLVFGAAPILRAMRADPHSAMRGAARVRLDVGRLLVAFQIALSMVLLVGASLFLRTLRNLHAIDPGFRTNQVTVMSLELLRSTYDQPVPEPVRIAVWDRLLAGVRALPGVQSASLSAMTPLNGEGRGIGLDAPGYQPRSDQDGRISLNTVSEDYFSTMGTPLLRGRAFTQNDRLGALPVALLNQSAAQHFFAGRDPIGIVVKANDHPYQIVGVVKDAKHSDLRQEAGRFIYVPLRQPMDRGLRMTLSIRAASGAPPVTAAVQRLVRDIGPDIVMTRADTLARQIDETLLRERVMSALAAAFGGLALVLSAVGLYGVLAYSVARRTGEIGIRVALGALPRQVAWGILRQTLWLVAIGLAAGIPASMLLAGVAESLLYGVTPTDAAAQASAAALLAAVALLASYLPARRASRIDPLAALRHE